MKKILLLSPTSRERSQLPAIAQQLGCEIVYDDFDEDYFDDLLGENPDFSKPSLPIVNLIEATADKYKDAGLAGVTSAVGYPGMSAASIIAKKLSLPGPPVEAIMLCEHKYYSRVYQQQLVAEATPEFHLIDPEDSTTLDDIIGFPSFLKPVKSCMSKNAFTVFDETQLRQLVKTSLLPNQFVDPFNQMLHAYTGFKQHATCLLQEALLHGVQVSLEGYVFANQVHVIGVVDAVMFPGSMAFKRWQYPSQLPPDVLARMSDIATRFFKGIGYNNALFNMELFYDRQSDRVSIIEVNPKIASQFPNLFEKVDGFSTYQTLLEVAIGQEPEPFYRKGKYRVSASCVLRVFDDHHVHAVPTEEQIQSVLQKFPDTRIQIYAKTGSRLSGQVQDASSFRYGLIDLGAQSEAELEEKFETCKSMLPFDLEPVFLQPAENRPTLFRGAD
ncbi:MAG: ATP-grasp domain-containing protein [Polaromonas sp.]